MRKLLRVLFLLSPIIIAGLAYWEYERAWQPPLNPDRPQYISLEALREHPDAYQAPMILILQGEVHNKTGNFLFLEWGGEDYFKVNCSLIDISAVEGGMTVYIRGVSYYHDLAKKYFLVENQEDIHIHVSYSLYLSIPGAVLILLVLFLGFKFNLDDFSFSRKPKEEEADA